MKSNEFDNGSVTVDDTLDDTSGQDTLILQGTRRDYDIVQNDDSTFTITDTVQGRDGTETLAGFDRIEFSDGQMSMTEALAAPQLSSASAVEADTLMALGETSDAQHANGWAEEVAVTDDNIGAQDEIALAQGALNIDADNTGAMALNSANELEGLAILGDSANY